MIGELHAGLGALAIALGALVFAGRKGTRRHVRLGWGYVACMAGVNLSALCIYRLTGRMNLFHLMAVAALAMVAVGLMQPICFRRSSRWLWRHYQYMCWSYVALLAATVNEAVVRLPHLRRFAAARFPALPVVASAVLVAASAMVIFARQRRLVPPVRR